MNADSSPFRKACDACTKSKSKCNGAQPCTACERRSEVCVYAFKRKRGPLKRKGSSQVRADDPLSAKRAHVADDEASARAGARPQEAALITPYERRLWTVFFTVFRNQESAFSGKKEKGIAWCWFARQLELIKQHSQRVGNDHLINMVNTFLESLDLRMQSVTHAIEYKCPFSASACADCASSALSAPAARLHASGGAGNGQGHGHGHGHEHHVAGGGALGLERVVRTADGQLATLDSVAPSVIAVDSATSLHDVPGSAVVLAMRRELDGNELPGFLIDMVEHPIARSTVRVNTKFTEAFGLSERDTNALLAWSGNGFLPWGADVLAKLMVSELDVVTYMQVMCLKFQAVGVPKNAAVREVPTAYSAKLWLKGGEDGALWEQKQCLIEVNHRILAVKYNVESTIICTIRVLGGAYDADETQSAPVVHETETEAKHKTHAGHVAETADEAADEAADAAAGMPAGLGFDQINGEYLDYFSGWEMAPAAPSVAYEAAATTHVEQPAQFTQLSHDTSALPRTVSNTQSSDTSTLLRTVSNTQSPDTSTLLRTVSIMGADDAEWLKGILDWTTAGVDPQQHQDQHQHQHELQHQLHHQ